MKDPQIRRFLSGSLFAGAFIWVAVTHFDVEMEVVWTFFLMSFVFVGGMMVIGLVLTPLFRLFNRQPPIVPPAESVNEAEKDSEPDSAKKTESVEG